MQSVESEVQDSKSGIGTPDAGLPDLAFGAEKMGLISLKARHRRRLRRQAAHGR